MEIRPSQDHTRHPVKPEAAEPTAGNDDRGTYGYGHRAHQPDPAASYAFRPGPARVLPTEQRRRWRVPG